MVDATRKNKDRHLIMEGFGTRLGAAMLIRNLTQVELADRAGISQVHVHQLLKKVSFPRLGLAQRLAFMLNVHYKWLKYGRYSEKSVITRKYPFQELFDTFGERLTFIMWVRGLSPATLAPKIGFTNSAIQYWQENKRTPHELSLQRISKFFNIHTNWLAPHRDFSLGYSVDGKPIWFKKSKVQKIEFARSGWEKLNRSVMQSLRSDLEKFVSSGGKPEWDPSTAIVEPDPLQKEKELGKHIAWLKSNHSILKR